jgi:hypothetical protein
VNEDSPGFIVTLRSVYDEVMRISAQLQTHTAKQDTSVALIEQRLAQVEGEIRQLYGSAQATHDRNEEERRHRSANKWLVIAALTGSAAAVVLALFLRLPVGH